MGDFTDNLTTPLLQGHFDKLHEKTNFLTSDYCTSTTAASLTASLTTSLTTTEIGGIDIQITQSPDKSRRVLDNVTKMQHGTGTISSRVGLHLDPELSGSFYPQICHLSHNGELSGTKSNLAVPEHGTTETNNQIPSCRDTLSSFDYLIRMTTSDTCISSPFLPQFDLQFEEQEDSKNNEMLNNLIPTPLSDAVKTDLFPRSCVSTAQSKSKRSSTKKLGRVVIQTPHLTFCDHDDSISTVPTSPSEAGKSAALLNSYRFDTRFEDEDYAVHMPHDDPWDSSESSETTNYLSNETHRRLPHSRSTISLPTADLATKSILKLDDRKDSSTYFFDKLSDQGRPRSKTFGGELLPRAPIFRPKLSSVYPTSLVLMNQVLRTAVAACSLSLPPSVCSDDEITFISSGGTRTERNMSIDACLSRLVQENNEPSISSLFEQTENPENPENPENEVIPE